MAIMSKLLKLRPFRLYPALQQVENDRKKIRLDNVYHLLQSQVHGLPTPTNAAEAQLLMNAMREDALARVGIDVKMEK